MKYHLILILDWVDDHILRHRFYWLCKRIGFSSWWQADRQIQNPFRRWHILEGKVVRVAAANASPKAKASSQFICTGDQDEKMITGAFEEFNHQDGNWTWGEVRRKREWRWPWQPKVKVTRLGEGGTVLLSEGDFNIASAIDTKGIAMRGVGPQTIMGQRGAEYPVR